ncbi:TetR/AcrR family transcriptional regulator C-terminal domain-containing protein [Nonomuraea sp. B12E4]|uniref:TetR/AcrR family transcriptional regulator C-terminal domain-containing protein n=1 Tax=Nonomuraea sp. B12E4 TaxID=3153564 RepID=UPI00325E15E0
MGDDTRAGLTRHTMIETALRLLDEVGLEGLTVRRLAAELGVKSPSLYWHIRTKQDLLDGVADAITRSAGMGPPRDGESWQEWLARRARAYRRAVLTHRDGARLVASGKLLGLDTVKELDRELAAMVERGFTPLLALDTIAAIGRYVLGFVLQEQNEHLPATPMDELAGLLDGGVSAPLLVALRDGGSMGEAAFEHGLRTLIDGTAAALARLPR